MILGVRVLDEFAGQDLNNAAVYFGAHSPKWCQADVYSYFFRAFSFHNLKLFPTHQTCLSGFTMMKNNESRIDTPNDRKYKGSNINIANIKPICVYALQEFVNFELTINWVNNLISLVSFID